MFVVSIVGAVTGTLALLLRIIDEFKAYLRLSVKVQLSADGWATILTTVDNSGYRTKGISYSFLLIGPEAEGPIETINVLAEAKGDIDKFTTTNNLDRFRVEVPLFVADRGIIPLPFYYSENVDIADETITYCAPVRLDVFTKEIPYSVRFFVFARGRLHRSTHDVFFIPN
jgi:hypothetical protein